jgi:NAD(P)-dependent dehydrogenase (short-subunit alcohol dehydrogenase family)
LCVELIHSLPIRRPEQRQDLVRKNAQKKVPLQRVGRPDEIASVALFLATDQADIRTSAGLASASTPS